MENSQIDQIENREKLISLGEIRHGRFWQTPTSFDLWELSKRRVQAQEVSKWQKGSKPVPDEVATILPDYAKSVIEHLENQIAEIRKLFPNI